ncbi:unnamed protein product [Protopolystoma xenopodis]|uniref:Uncharacterized protein n=1 Tax=Protopolystoma xenopodis TaxID=117903 RepID=A0A448XE43_9PLAT|nr:unnamed protein product [Protopolystoma xenopodis]
MPCASFHVSFQAPGFHDPALAPHVSAATIGHTAKPGQTYSHFAKVFPALSAPSFPVTYAGKAIPPQPPISSSPEYYAAPLYGTVRQHHSHPAVPSGLLDPGGYGHHFGATAAVDCMPVAARGRALVLKPAPELASATEFRHPRQMALIAAGPMRPQPPPRGSWVKELANCANSMPKLGFAFLERCQQRSTGANGADVPRQQSMVQDITRQREDGVYMEDVIANRYLLACIPVVDC